MHSDEYFGFTWLRHLVIKDKGLKLLLYGTHLKLMKMAAHKSSRLHSRLTLTMYLDFEKMMSLPYLDNEISARFQT